MQQAENNKQGINQRETNSEETHLTTHEKTGTRRGTTGQTGQEEAKTSSIVSHQPMDNKQWNLADAILKSNNSSSSSQNNAPVNTHSR
jgi:hypothetical protein